MKLNFIHLLKILAVETLYVFAFYIYYSAFIDSFWGLNIYNYTITNHIIYLLFLFTPLTIYNIYKAFKYKKSNQSEKSKNYLIAQLFFIVIGIVI